MKIVPFRLGAYVSWSGVLHQTCQLAVVTQMVKFVRDGTANGNTEISLREMWRVVTGCNQDLRIEVRIVQKDRSMFKKIEHYSRDRSMFKKIEHYFKG
jgi:hypothetical protein